MSKISFCGTAVLLTTGLTILATDDVAAKMPIPAVKLPLASYVTAAAAVGEMTPGMRQAYVRGIQEALGERGYNAGPVDGRLGPMTRSAIRRYQRDVGLPVTGEATDELLDHLNFARTKATASRRAAPSRLVLDIQRALRDRGYDPGPADGLMGRRTRQAIKLYQAEAGLPGTGEADADLLQELTGNN